MGFDEAFKFVMKWETTKFTNRPSDRGGPTCCGVTQKTYNSYRKKKNLHQKSVEFITPDETHEIYETEYWNAFKTWGLDDKLWFAAFNDAVMSGATQAGGLIKLCHKDVKTFLGLQEHFYHRIVEHDPGQQVNLQGWLNRLNDLRKVLGVS